MNNQILFIDPVCPKPYIISDVYGGRMGGTEATVCRVVRELSKRFTDPTPAIAQRHREVPYLDEQLVTYHPLSLEGAPEPNIVVTLRDGVEYRKAKDKYPKARHYLWLHDTISGAYQQHLEETLGVGVHDVVFVSSYAQQQALESIPGIMRRNVRPHIIYNMVENDYARSLGYEPKRLVFLSSPHKGLNQVLEYFKELRQIDPEFSLEVANPGYFPDPRDLPEGVIPLRCATHQDLMTHLRGALCLFYPQDQFAETFGIVYAEANANGIPVLGLDVGAIREIVDGQSQVVSRDKVIETVLKWSKGERPTVGLKSHFRSDTVTKEWVKLFLFGRGQ